MGNIMTEISKSPAIKATGQSTSTTAEPVDRFSQVIAARKAMVQRDSERQDSAERDRGEDMGGLRLKLAVVGEIPGHHLYWANDESGQIEQLLYEGFDFVAPDEVRRASELVSDMDLSNRISRFVGQNADGSPLRAYLLKCPTDIWGKRKEREQWQANDWDRGIREGRMQPKGRHEYTPAGYTSRLDTNSKV